MPHRALSAVAAIALVLAPATAGVAASSAATAKTCRDRAEIRKVWSGGTVKKGVTRNRTPHENRVLKEHVTFSTPLSEANRRSDRDRDGIACEKECALRGAA